MAKKKVAKVSKKKAKPVDEVKIVVEEPVRAEVEICATPTCKIPVERAGRCGRCARDLGL